jgi:hypothetical protein
VRRQKIDRTRVRNQLNVTVLMNRREERSLNLKACGVSSMKYASARMSTFSMQVKISPLCCVKMRAKGDELVNPSGPFSHYDINDIRFT